MPVLRAPCGRKYPAPLYSGILSEIVRECIWEIYPKFRQIQVEALLQMGRYNNYESKDNLKEIVGLRDDEWIKFEDDVVNLRLPHNFRNYPLKTNIWKNFINARYPKITERQRNALIDLAYHYYEMKQHLKEIVGLTDQELNDVIYFLQMV